MLSLAVVIVREIASRDETDAELRYAAEESLQGSTCRPFPCQSRPSSTVSVRVPKVANVH